MKEKIKSFLKQNWFEITIIIIIILVLVGSVFYGYEWQPVLIPILLLVIAFFIERRKEYSNRLTQQRIENFRNLLEGSTGFFSNFYKDVFEQRKKQQKFLEEYVKSWISAPDDIIRAINAFFIEAQFAGKNPYESESEQDKKNREKMAEILLRMRKQILGETELTEKDFYIWSFSK